MAPLEGPGRQRTAVIEALGAGWTRLPDLPDEAYVLETDDSAAGLPVEPADPGRRGGAERPGRGALGARRRLRAAGARRAGQGGGGGLAQRRAGAGARGAPGARADRHLGRAAALVRALRAGRAGPGHRSRAGGRCATAPRSPRPAAGRHRALSVLRKSVGEAPITEAVEEARPLAGGVPPALGGRAGLRRPGRPALATRPCRRTTRPDLVATGLAGLSPGRGGGGLGGVRQLVARWRAVQLLERCN